MITAQQAKTKVKQLLQKHEICDGVLLIQCPFSYCNVYHEVCNTPDILDEIKRRQIEVAIQPYLDKGQEESIVQYAMMIGFILACESLAGIIPEKNPKEWQIYLLTQALERMRTMTEAELMQFLKDSLASEVEIYD